MIELLLWFRKMQLKAVEHMLVTVEYKWEFEWPHDAKHTKFYDKHKQKLERSRLNLRYMLGLHEGEEA